MACNKIQNEYNSITQQKKVRKCFQNLSLVFVMEHNSCDVLEALVKVCEAVTKFAPQEPRTHRSEEGKM